MVNEIADFFDVPVADEAVALGGGGVAEQRGQGFSSHCAPWPEIGSVGNAAAGFNLGDAQPVSQCAAQRAAQLFLAGLRVEFVDQRMLGCA